MSRLSKHTNNIGKYITLVKDDTTDPYKPLEEGTVGKIVKTYSGGMNGLSLRPAVVLEIKRKDKSPIRRIVFDQFVSDETLSLRLFA